MGLFESKTFIGHAGGELTFKIECDALTPDDYATLATLIGEKLTFSKVVGVPSGGLPLAEALEQYCAETGPLLIVDDVLTTGTSMEEVRKQVDSDQEEVIGLVIFSRGRCPDWVKSIFQLSEWAQS